MTQLSKTAFFTALLIFGCVAFGAARAEGLPPTAMMIGFTFSRDLSLGIRGNDVTALQQFLIDGKYLDLATPTDYFGPLTKAALRSWQTSADIYPASGFFGPLSRGKINAALQSAPTDVTGTRPQAGTTTAATANDTQGYPTRLIIPKLNIDAGFQYNGLNSDNTLEVPSNIYDVGWFTGSARPGEKGVAIVTGHVAQIRASVVTKPGVFSSLYELSVGDTLSVTKDNGATVTFVVRAIRDYDPTADATDVFTATDGGAHMNLITCEGTWNQAQLSYTQRLVVFTDAVK
jgi:LPXTG-site transpeptidase (sortase) family protein